MEITKVGPNHVIVREILTVKDINGRDVEIYGPAEKYGAFRVEREIAEIDVLIAKREQLLMIQEEFKPEAL